MAENLLAGRRALTDLLHSPLSRAVKECCMLFREFEGVMPIPIQKQVGISGDLRSE
jgi:hypothetical protein